MLAQAVFEELERERLALQERRARCHTLLRAATTPQVRDKLTAEYQRLTDRGNRIALAQDILGGKVSVRVEDERCRVIWFEDIIPGASTPGRKEGGT